MSAWCLGILKQPPQIFSFLYGAGYLELRDYRRDDFIRKCVSSKIIWRKLPPGVRSSEADCSLRFSFRRFLFSSNESNPFLISHSESVRTVVRNFFPVFFSRGVVQISAYVDAMIASFLGDGPTSLLQYTQSLYTLPSQFIRNVDFSGGASGNGERDRR